MSFIISKTEVSIIGFRKTETRNHANELTVLKDMRRVARLMIRKESFCIETDQIIHENNADSN